MFKRGSREVCRDGWSGFLIAPDTILTIAHAFKDLSNDDLKASGMFWVEFFEGRAGTLEAATLIRLDFLSEFGLLRCRSPNLAHIFTFASHKILSSTSILLVSHVPCKGIGLL
ncbi:hypothetical protein QL285_073718 [Trifolium repens]|nr:hypothetical protein QL285_073718 [Trifolium repens]